MGIATASYVDGLIRSELTNTQFGTNHNIYDKRLTATHPSTAFTYVPRCIHFYYIVFDENNQPRADHFFYNNGPKNNPGEWNEIPTDQVEFLIPDLIANARSTGIKNPVVSGNNFYNIQWRRKSYVLIVIDEDDWPFQRRNNGNIAAAFNISKGSTPNHSFFDAMDIEVDIPNGSGGTDTRYAIAFINHMKRNADGDDLIQGDTQRFEFDAYVDVKYAPPAAPPLKIILDPGGTNQGPVLLP